MPLGLEGSGPEEEPTAGPQGRQELPPHPQRCRRQEVNCRTGQARPGRHRNDANQLSTQRRPAQLSSLENMGARLWKSQFEGSFKVPRPLPQQSPHTGEDGARRPEGLNSHPRKA